MPHCQAESVKTRIEPCAEGERALVLAMGFFVCLLASFCFVLFVPNASK